MFVYKVISKNHYSPETGAYISFGISAHDPEHGQTSSFPMCSSTSRKHAPLQNA